MKGLVALARRELVVHRKVFLAAAAAGLLPIAVPVARGLHGQPARAVRDLAAYSVVAAFAVVLALLLGSSVLARELAQRRLSFYFSRPLSGFAIWSGKLLGATLLVLGASILALVPTFLANGGELPRSGPAMPTLPLLLAAAIALLPISHAVGVAFRSRSAFFLLDLLLALLATLLVALSSRALLRELGSQTLSRGVAFFAAAILFAFLAAGYASVSSGRTDIRAAHRALSRTLWGLIGLATILFSAYAYWADAAAR